MKWKGHFPAVPGVWIAVSAAVLGSVITGAIMTAAAAHEGVARPFSFSPLVVAGLVAAIILVAGLVILRALADREFETERHLLNAFLEHIPDNVYFKDRNSRFVRINRAMAEYVGLADPGQAVSKTDCDIFTSEHAVQALEDEKRIMETGLPLIGMEEKETWPDGHETWVLTTKVPLKELDGRVVGTMGISRDITDRKEAELRIRYMALHDALTGLPNRSLLEDRLGQAIAFACRNQKRVAVFMLDLDHFKNVNDSYGHYLGDRLLEAVSIRLRECLRASDIVARHGGDEFVVALPAVEPGRDIERVARKLLGGLSEPFQIDGHNLRIGASVGICEYPAHGENPRDLLQAADTAMYEAKKRGRGSCCRFTPDLTDATRRRLKMEFDLRHALEREEFVLYYQPLVSTTTGKITAMEALLRWRHAEEGIISPNLFIPQAEEMGLMVPIGRWVLKTACAQNAAWQRQGLPPVRMLVNLSANQFYRNNIVGDVESALSESGLDPRWLELELTELVMLDDTNSTDRIMRRLKKIGVSLSLDDFGTGWSSLSYLRRFPIDRIKIDRSFLRDLASQPAAEAVVRTIINLGRDLGLDCVAEGVETPDQLNYFRQQNCKEVQGFLYSPALPEAECSALLSLGRLGFAEDALGPAIPPLAVVPIASEEARNHSMSN